MDTIRTMLFAALALVLFMMWQAWEKDYGTVAQVPAPTSTTAQPATPGAADIPSAPAISSDAPAITPAIPSSAPKGQRIKVSTDVYDIEIDTRGGDIVKAKLPNYPLGVEPGAEAFTLMNDGDPFLFIAQSGLLAKGSPDHTTTYATQKTEYTLAEGDDSLKVVLSWQGANGLSVNKIYTFHRDRYDINLDYQVTNRTAANWQGSVYRQFKRTENTGVDESSFIYTYTGGVVSNSEEPYEKIDYDDMRDQNLKQDMTGGWTAMIQHYFLGAWIAGDNEANHVYSKVSDGNKFVLGMVTPAQTVASGESKTISTRMFVGPKLQEKLEAVAPNLELTVDFGWLTIISKPLFWLLQWFYDLIGNWGWAIIAVTVVIKLVFYKLSETSYRSMAKLREVHPRLQALKERYGDDRQGMQQAMMKIYQKEKINPLGGCLPILIQIPVFIALYWVLLESVELRQASFILWLDDLSNADPYFVLPLLMGATMILQQRLNPSPLDPVQQKVMMMLPIVFTVFFAFFPAGLVLYWVANNILSITQQWVITKRVAAGK